MNTMNEATEYHIPAVNMPDMIAMTARLAQVLAQEVDLLETMKISDIEGLQKEKLVLTSALEKQRKLIEADPSILYTLTPDELEDFQSVASIFNTILEENHRQLLIAKEVNQKIVEAISEVVAEASSGGMYNGKGNSDAPRKDSLAVSINKTI